MANVYDSRKPKEGMSSILVKSVTAETAPSKNGFFHFPEANIYIRILGAKICLPTDFRLQ